jgi:hypothetical protein
MYVGQRVKCHRPESLAMASSLFLSLSLSNSTSLLQTVQASIGVALFLAKRCSCFNIRHVPRAEHNIFQSVNVFLLPRPWLQTLSYMPKG